MLASKYNCSEPESLNQGLAIVETVVSSVETEPSMNVVHSKGTYLFRQSLLGVSALLSGISAGCTFGYTSILFPQLHNSTVNNATNNVELDSEEESWIASVPTLSMIPATLFTAWALEYFGRKKMAIVAISCNWAGWIIMYFTQSYKAMLISRAFSGIFAGTAYSVLVTYLGEVIAPSLRALFLSFLPLGCTVGVFTCQLLGIYFNWKTIALMLSFIPVYDIVIVGLVVSESYIWHKNHNRIKKAYVAFTWFRGFHSEARNEFNKATEMVIVFPNRRTTFWEQIRSCADKSFITPFGITTLAFITNQLSGNMALFFYTSTIIEIISDDPNLNYYSTIVLNILRIAGTMVSCILVKVSSIKKVLIYGGLVLVVSLVNLSLFLYISTIYPESKAYPIVCMISVISNVIAFAASLGPLPSVICGELYPAKVRGIGGPLSACCSFISLFIIVKIMPSMLEVLTPAGTFLFFAVCTLVCVNILVFMLPETKNKTLKDIENIYKE